MTSGDLVDDLQRAAGTAEGERLIELHVRSADGLSLLCAGVGDQGVTRDAHRSGVAAVSADVQQDGGVRPRSTKLPWMAKAAVACAAARVAAKDQQVQRLHVAVLVIDQSRVCIRRLPELFADVHGRDVSLQLPDEVIDAGAHDGNQQDGASGNGGQNARPAAA